MQSLLRRAACAALLASALSAHAYPNLQSTVPSQACRVQAGFSPRMGAMDLVVNLIDAAPAGQQLDVAAYEFTNHRMGAALEAAVRRGVHVRIAVDATENEGKSYSIAYRMAAAGAEVRFEHDWPVFHDKYVIVPSIGGLETGSLNYTAKGENQNRENALVMTGCFPLAQTYERDFEDLWPHGTPIR